MLVKLRQLQNAAGIVSLGQVAEPWVENETEFDEVGHAAPASTSATALRTTQAGIVCVEREILTLPSNGNVAGGAYEVEIAHRIKQARRQITRLRDIIADISFQYSHVIRGAIRQSIRTTAQKRVKSLHNELVLHARIYARCRGRLMALNCDERRLSPFRVLSREDLKASTAILRPNVPGSSTLQLSWIWQTGRWHLFGADAGGRAGTVEDAVADPASLLECS